MKIRQRPLVSFITSLRKIDMNCSKACRQDFLVMVVFEMLLSIDVFESWYQKIIDSRKTVNFDTDILNLYLDMES